MENLVIMLMNASLARVEMRTLVTITTKNNHNSNNSNQGKAQANLANSDLIAVLTFEVNVVGS